MIKLKEPTDDELVRSYLDGNQSAFDALLKRHESRLFTYIAYSVKNDEQAQDLFQECFMRIITRLHKGQYTDSGKFVQWMIRIAHNLIVDHHRNQFKHSTLSNDATEKDLFEDAAIEMSQSRENEIINQQTLEDVRCLIAMLPDQQREVIMLRFYQELSFKEIAAATGVSINTALGRVRYALINLRRLARQYNISWAS